MEAMDWTKPDGENTIIEEAYDMVIAMDFAYEYCFIKFIFEGDWKCVTKMVNIMGNENSRSIKGFLILNIQSRLI